MDGFGGIVLGVQILLLVAGYLLFQHAKTELTARAAQMPILSEVKALQKSVVSLIEQLKLESTQTSAQLEARCVEARDLLAALDRKLEEAQQAPVRAAVRRRSATGDNGRSARPVEAPAPQEAQRPSNPRQEAVYSLADQGLQAGQIAQQTGISEGEVEMILGLRQKIS